MDVDDALAEQLAAEVDAQGLPLRQAATRITDTGWPVTHPLVRRMVSGTRRITAAEWLTLAYALAVPPIALLTGRTVTVGNDRDVSPSALQSWIVGATPLPAMADTTTEDDATRTTRYLDAARARSDAGSEFGDYLRRMADAFDRAPNREREGIVLDMLQHMAGIGMQQAQRAKRRRQ